MRAAAPSFLLRARARNKNAGKNERGTSARDKKRGSTLFFPIRFAVIKREGDTGGDNYNRIKSKKRDFPRD